MTGCLLSPGVYISQLGFFFTSCLPDYFSCSPKLVKEAIMTDINNLVQVFWKTSSDGAVGAPSFEMGRLLEILIFRMCLLFISVFATAVDLADKDLQRLADPNSCSCSAHSYLDDRIRARFKILLDGYRKMFDQSLSKSKDLGDMLRFLPGVVVQKQMNMQGMADLYRIKPDLLKRLIDSTFDLLRPFLALYPPRYILDGYLSGFLLDRDRSQLCYCDPMLQHISICLHLLSLPDESNDFDLRA